MFVKTAMSGVAGVTGTETVRRFSGLDRLRAVSQRLNAHWNQWRDASPVPRTKDLRATHSLALSSTSLGMTLAGLALAQPWLSLASVPLALYVFVPTFRNAYQSLHQERRIDNQVLDATRVALCVVLGYDAILALNALLLAASQEFFARSEATFRRQLQALPGNDAALARAVQHALLNAVAEKSATQADGEANARRMAPWMLTSFILSWPILGPNRAAAFLTTGFGTHLRTLGPFTVRKTVLAAAQAGIVIKDARALEAAMQIDTVVLDARLLRDDAARTSVGETMTALRTQLALGEKATPPAVYLLVEDGDAATPHSLAAPVVYDGLIDGTAWDTHTNPFDQAGLNGRTICYVGPSSEDRQACMVHATLAVAWRNPDALTNDAVQVVLLDGDLTALLRLQELAATFTQKQRSNLHTPIGFDLVDIGTTVFMHLGLSYSVLLNFAGLFTAAAYADRTLRGTDSHRSQECPNRQ